MAWKADATTGEVLAGGKGWGNRLDQETDSLLICDRQNRRVMCWPRLPSSHRRPEIVISNISCFGLTIDNQGSLYVSDYMKHEVRRYDKGIVTTKALSLLVAMEKETISINSIGPHICSSMLNPHSTYRSIIIIVS